MATTSNPYTQQQPPVGVEGEASLASREVLSGKGTLRSGELKRGSIDFLDEERLERIGGQLAVISSQ